MELGEDGALCGGDRFGGVMSSRSMSSGDIVGEGALRGVGGCLACCLSFNDLPLDILREELEHGCDCRVFLCKSGSDGLERYLSIVL